MKEKGYTVTLTVQVFVEAENKTQAKKLGYEMLLGEDGVIGVTAVNVERNDYMEG